MDYDVIIIGAGLSGLAAAVRLTHFGRKVRIFERHCFPGGLNSWYYRNGEVIDVGLHALTNYVPASHRSAPLNMMLRQLRLRRDVLELCPQTYSLIEFPGQQLCLNNDFAAFSNEITRNFPDQADGFQRLLEHIRHSDYFASQAPFQSAQEVVSSYLTSRQLRDILFMPLMYYGNPCVEDMDFKQFCIMFHSIYLEGFSRPKVGMKGLIQTLVERIRSAGGELTLNNGIAEIHGDGQRITSVTDDKGQTHQAETFISCIGARETATLCNIPLPEWLAARPGQIGFLETIFTLAQPPASFGIKACTLFRNEKAVFRYAPPETPVDFDSQVYCMPGNYQGCEEIPAARHLRMTHLANPTYWLNLTPEANLKAKETVLARQKEILAASWPELAESILSAEVMTPKTIFRYTGRLNGSIYGSPDKFSNGTCSLKNLFLCGTDQGLVGIVGSLLSGIATVNRHFLT
ncbi:MAG: NAD(P)/FAD-dependent oxidoreductase [Lentisphaerae bacterium]|jgi:phytoene dehydrogenase-like protein|nr:NAD(P)/FAD-dependent oxidoreductase [Lentisphaerota bacterium]